MKELVGEMFKSIITYLLLGIFCSAYGQNLQLDHVRTFNGHTHGVRKVVFSPDGNHFASGGTRGELFIWNIDGAGALKKLEGHYGSVTDVRYCQSGKYIVTAGEDGQIKVWDSSSGYCVQTIVSSAGHNSPDNKVNFAILSTKTGMVYFGGANKTLSQVPFKSDDASKALYTDSKDPIQCAVVSPDGTEIIFAAGQYLMALNLKSESVVREYNTGSCKVNALEFSADGKRLLTWCSNSRVDMRDPSNFYLVTSFRSGSSGRKFSNLAFTDDQKYVITGDHASRFNIWDLDRKELVLDQWAEQGTIMTFDLQNGPNYLLSGSLDKSIKLWQIVPQVEEEVKKKKGVKKQPEMEQVVEPEVEIVQYVEPVQDVPQVETPQKGPASINVQLKQPETVNTYEPVQVERTIVSELPERVQNRRVKPIRKEHRLEMKGGVLTFEIWDAQVIDGDIVSIYVGDECIVKEYSITAAKKKASFDASRFKRVYVYLHAHNLGTLPPNTVTMTVSDGEVTHEIEMRSDLAGSSALEITFEE